jgi:hypothetical protein
MAAHESPRSTKLYGPHEGTPHPGRGGENTALKPLSIPFDYSFDFVLAGVPVPASVDGPEGRMLPAVVKGENRPISGN